MTNLKFLVFAFIASVLITPTSAYSANGSFQYKAEAQEPNCKVGYIYSAKKKKCVRKP